MYSGWFSPEILSTASCRTQITVSTRSPCRLKRVARDLATEQRSSNLCGVSHPFYVAPLVDALWCLSLSDGLLYTHQTPR